MLFLLLSAPLVTAFIDVSVLPMDRNVVLPHQTVIVRGHTIESVGPASSIKVPAGAARIDGKGKFLMPGLVDMHVHLYAPAELKLNLANGITTVYNLNGRPAHLRWRDEISAGKRVGPSIVTCGPTVFQCDTAAEAKARVDEMAKQGYDAVKIYNEVGKDAFPALIETARSHKMLTVGHIAREPGFDSIVNHRMPIAHAEELLYTVFDDGKTGPNEFPEVARRLVKAGIPITATLVCFHHIWRQALDLKAHLARPSTAYLAPWVASAWQPGTNTYERRFNNKSSQDSLERLLRFQIDFLKVFHREGGTILAGTDANCPGSVPGFELDEEVRNLTKCGLTPYEALRAATADSARVLGREREFGSVKKGMRADLVLFDANPADDLANLSKRSGVMARGRWLSRTDIKAMLAKVPTEYAAQAQTSHDLLTIDPKRAQTYLAENDPFGGLGSSTIQKLSMAGGYRVFYRKMKSVAPDSSMISEEAVNEMGYWWLNAKKDTTRAIDIFLLNTEEHPTSANAWDSLGEAYVAAGQKDKAVSSYRKALEIDPKLESSLQALKKLGG